MEEEDPYSDLSRSDFEDDECANSLTSSSTSHGEKLLASVENARAYTSDMFDRGQDPFAGDDFELEDAHLLATLGVSSLYLSDTAGLNVAAGWASAPHGQAPGRNQGRARDRDQRGYEAAPAVVSPRGGQGGVRGTHASTSAVGRSGGGANIASKQTRAQRRKGLSEQLQEPSARIVQLYTRQSRLAPAAPAAPISPAGALGLGLGLSSQAYNTGAVGRKDELSASPLLGDGDAAGGGGGAGGGVGAVELALDDIPYVRDISLVNTVAATTTTAASAAATAADGAQEGGGKNRKKGKAAKRALQPGSALSAAAATPKHHRPQVAARAQAQAEEETIDYDYEYDQGRGRDRDHNKAPAEKRSFGYAPVSPASAVPSVSTAGATTTGSTPSWLLQSADVDIATGSGTGTGADAGLSRVKRLVEVPTHGNNDSKCAERRQQRIDRASAAAAAAVAATSGSGDSKRGATRVDGKGKDKARSKDKDKDRDKGKDKVRGKGKGKGNKSEDFSQSQLAEQEVQATVFVYGQVSLARRPPSSSPRLAVVDRYAGGVGGGDGGGGMQGSLELRASAPEWRPPSHFAGAEARSSAGAWP